MRGKSKTTMIKSAGLLVTGFGLNLLILGIISQTAQLKDEPTRPAILDQKQGAPHPYGGDDLERETILSSNLPLEE